MSKKRCFYADEETRFSVQNDPNIAKYDTIDKDAALERHAFLINEINEILTDLFNVHDIECNIRFLLVFSLKPFQVTSDNVLIIDTHSCSDLLALCARIEKLPPICNLLKIEEHLPCGDFENKFLVDIVINLVKKQNYGTKYYTWTGLSALVFVISHEVAHIIHGHMKFQSSKEEYDLFSRDDEDEVLTRRTLEMDADCSAVSSVHHILEQVLYPKMSILGYLPAISLEQLRLRYILGMYVAWLYHDARSAPKFDKKYYVSSYARFLITQNILLQSYERDQQIQAMQLPEFVRGKLMSAFVYLNKNLSALGYPMATNVTGIDDGKIYSEYSDIGVFMGLDDSWILNNRWAKLYPILLKYKTGGTLATPSAVAV